MIEPIWLIISRIFWRNIPLINQVIQPIQMLAVVIPYYKREFFQETLGSLAKQSNKQFRVYIGNDASPEGPDDLIDSFRNDLDLTYCRFEKNLGKISLTRQWERCIDLVKNEEWVMILGDDDYISQHYVQKFYENLSEIESLNINVVRFSTREVWQSEKEISKLYTHPKIENSTDFFFRKFFRSSRGSLSEHIFKREAFLKHGFRNFPLGWGADNFAWLDFTEFGKIYTINDATAFFRISEVNISRKGHKEDVKQYAKYLYFTTLIYGYLSKFQQKQRIPLLLYYEQIIYKSQKVSFNFWIKMCTLFLKEKEYIQIIKFSRRIIIYLAKK